MDDLWYSEYHTPHVRYSIQVTKQLWCEQSDYQHIAIYESPEFGRFLTLDGVMMLTERDEFIYHEMMVHVPMAVQPTISKVLVIGAGDGGIARELTKYPQIAQVDLVEIDGRVIDLCREFLPQTGCGFDDPRVHIQIEDGLRYIRTVENQYDLIIVDSTDPSGPGEVLFTREFYGNCHKALTENGILVNQHESPFYEEDARAMTAAHKRIAQVFPVAQVYQAHIPTYPSGHWLFGFASKGILPTGELGETPPTRYYNKALHKGAFALPNYVLEALER